MADLRSCQQCGAAFVPRREHARFCSVACRVAWNRAHLGDPAVEVSALQWSIAGMGEAVQRLAGAGAQVRGQALMLIGEAVWWVTIVDATLVRHHVQAYDRVMAGLCPADRRGVEGTLAGLRFVRNQLGHQVDLAELAAPGPGSQRVGDWVWRPVPEPSLARVPRRARAWEMTRYRAYQAQLAGHPVGEIFGRAAEFLQLIGVDCVPAAELGMQITR
ncbi:MAG TPA: hypothetical protein VKS82_07515 [Streptosporangiaceae bacterium]|nr:hypothetical protein [Streptosporangiaceae bacterium]